MSDITIIGREDTDLKIKELTIQGVGGIKNKLHLTFQDGLNIICGANGIGKTTILNVISDFFNDSSNTIKKHVSVEVGEYTICYERDNTEESTCTFYLKSSKPEAVNSTAYNWEISPYLLNFNTFRDIKYTPLPAMPRDNIRDGYSSASLNSLGVSADDIKGWLANRFAFSDKEGSLSPQQQENFVLAKNSFKMLDENTEFYTVKSSTYDVLLKTPSGEIYLEYLSSGYKTCLHIILGIIKELDFRFIEPPITAKDFDGIILIDEIDLHLHPTWQAKLVNILKTMFSKAQIIATTHSPSILQALYENEIIALAKDESENIFIKELNLGKYGLHGWSLEEILKDIMDMPSTTSKLYEDTMASFSTAILDEDYSSAKTNFDILDEMLHPDSVNRTLLKIQMAGLEE